MSAEQVIRYYGDRKLATARPDITESLLVAWGMTHENDFSEATGAVFDFNESEAIAQLTVLINATRNLPLKLSRGASSNRTQQDRIAGLASLDRKLKALPSESSYAKKTPSAELLGFDQFNPRTEIFIRPKLVQRVVVFGPNQRQGEFAIVRLMGMKQDERTSEQFYYEPETRLRPLGRELTTIPVDKFGGVVIELPGIVVDTKISTQDIKAEIIRVPADDFVGNEGSIGRDQLIELLKASNQYYARHTTTIPTFSGKHIVYKKEGGNILLQDKGSNQFLIHVQINN